MTVTVLVEIVGYEDFTEQFSDNCLLYSENIQRLLYT